MFNINLFTFSKRENSTLRPSGSPDVLQCNIIRGSSMISPVLELDLGTSSAPAYNYAYIPDFNRYYYIRDWSFDSGFWTASLECDVLATYRGTIGSASLYALRTSNSTYYDTNLVDTMYPTATGCSFDSESVSSPFSLTATGVYILGVTNNNPNFGSIKYYIVRATDMPDIIEYLLSDTLMTDYSFSTTDASYELQRALIDPIQYIKSCIYIPMTYQAIETLYTNYHEQIKIFKWAIKDSNNTAINCAYINATNPFHTYTKTINIPKHPQTSTRGNYTNTAPYTLLTLLVPPFGMLDIDTTVTCNAASLDIAYKIDFPTGLGILTVSCNGIVINRMEAQIGVPVQLSQVSRDYLGTVTSIANGVGGILSSINPVNKFGMAGGIVSSASSAINSAVNAIQARSQTVGSGGSYAQLDSDPTLYAQFFSLVSEDLAHNGRPCCRMLNPSVGGYFLIRDGDVAISGTQAEASAVRSYLESGFYWE